MNESKNTDYSLSAGELKELNQKITRKADRLTEPLLFVMFGFGLFLAHYYDTWFIALGAGGTCLMAYYSTKKLLPDSTLYHYVLSAVAAFFSSQYIYQMHGMAEMHFWVFISSALLIIYQNWRLQIPLIVIVLVHHGTFGYLQYTGHTQVYFTQLSYMDMTSFLFHGFLASCICLISGIWAYNIHLSAIRNAVNYKAIFQMKAELQVNADKMKGLNENLMQVNIEVQEKNEELRASEEKLTASGEQLQQMNEYLNRVVIERTQALLNQNKSLVQHAYINAHKVRSPLARILGLVNIINHELELKENSKDILHHLHLSATELDDILTEVRINLEKAEFKSKREF
jgi:signal transduction histidine kinase